MSAEYEQELTDVVLCYQALGTDLSASPAKLGHLYNSLTEEYKKKLASQDAATREAARANLEQVNEMYRKIKDSTTYRTMEKEHLKRNANQAEAVAKKAALGAKAVVRVHCTCCNGLIPKGLRICPICKSPLYSGLERTMRAHLAPKKLVLYFVILSAVSLAFIGVQYPEMLSTQALSELLQRGNN